MAAWTGSSCCQRVFICLHCSPTWRNPITVILPHGPGLKGTGDPIEPEYTREIPGPAAHHSCLLPFFQPESILHPADTTSARQLPHPSVTQPFQPPYHSCRHQKHPAGGDLRSSPWYQAIANRLQDVEKMASHHKTAIHRMSRVTLTHCKLENYSGI